MEKKIRILMLEDIESDAMLIERYLSKEKIAFSSVRVETKDDFIKNLWDFKPDIILADYSLPQFDGLSALKIIKKDYPEIPFIFVSGAIGEERAVESLKSGATDYILKDNLSKLGSSILRALNEFDERKKRRSAEESLQIIIHKLARSNSELEQFAYVVSHDLQSPLRTICSYVQLLVMRYKDIIDPEAKKLIDCVIDGSERMKNTIDDLLEYSRVSANFESYAESDLNIVINNALVNLKMPIEESGAVITRDKLPNIVCNKIQIISLFQNLIGNSIKFRGKVQPKVHISAEKKDNEWIFCIKDNGIGFKQEFSDRLFIIFKRLHNKDEYPGTGIGLALCKKIVENHGGRIWAQSSLGKGAAFYFAIPDKINPV